MDGVDITSKMMLDHIKMMLDHVRMMSLVGINIAVFASEISSKSHLEDKSRKVMKTAKKRQKGNNFCT